MNITQNEIDETINVISSYILNEFPLIQCVNDMPDCRFKVNYIDQAIFKIAYNQDRRKFIFYFPPNLGIHYNSIYVINNYNNLILNRWNNFNSIVFENFSEVKENIYNSIQQTIIIYKDCLKHLKDLKIKERLSEMDKDFI